MAPQALNMIPTKTGAVALVLLCRCSMASLSAFPPRLAPDRPHLHREEVRSPSRPLAAAVKAAEGELKGVLKYTEIRSSLRYRGRPNTSIADATETIKVTGNLRRRSCPGDNEATERLVRLTAPSSVSPPESTDDRCSHELRCPCTHVHRHLAHHLRFPPKGFPMRTILPG